MEKLIMFLQLFAEAGTLVNATQYYVNAYTGDTQNFTPGSDDLSPLNKTFWDTAALDNMRDEFVYTQLGKKQSLPPKHGMTVEWRRPRTIERVHMMREGVIPTGLKMGVVAITATISQYGDYVAVTDRQEAHSIDDIRLTYLEELSGAAGQTLEELTRNELMLGTNIMFADATNKSTGAYDSTPSTKAQLLTKLATLNCNVTVDTLLKATTELFTTAKGKKYSGGYYLCVVHPHVAEDIKRDNAWIEAHKYAAVEEIFNGEIGRMHGIRFLMSNYAPVIKEDGDSYATYKTMIFCKDAFGVIDPEDGGLETIIKTREQVGGPLNQFGTVGVKFETGAKILYQERMLTIWSGSSRSGTATTNIVPITYQGAA